MKLNLSAIVVTVALFLISLSSYSQNFQLLRDINVNTNSNPANYINNLYLRFDNDFLISSPRNGAYAVLNGVAYFAADDGIHGTELWRSDNTAAGTYLVKDLTAGSTSSDIESLTVAGGKLFFTATHILYVSDGTESGTVAVPGITYNSDITTCLTASKNLLYFLTTVGKLWKTDGNTTSLIFDFRDTYGGTKDYLGQLTNVNGTVFFTTGVDNEYGAELWKTDGTSAGTVMVKDINPGSNGSSPSNLTSDGGKLYFSANDGTGTHLWVSDGTANGTKAITNSAGALLSPVSPSPVGRNDISPFAVMNDILFFSASSSTSGNELFKYDPSHPASGVVLLKDIIPGEDSSNPFHLTAAGNTLYFSATGLNGDQQLWKSDGTKSGTLMIKSMGDGVPTDFASFADGGGQLLFSYNSDKGYELWKSDGTASGTIMLKDIYQGYRGSNPSGITRLKNNISLFSADNGQKGIELWHTDGTTSGTTLLKDINKLATASSTPDVTEGVILNSKLYFSAYDPVYENGLYISDGTGAGTRLIKDIDPKGSDNPANFTVFKNKVYFSADSEGYHSIYKTDGTAAGTKKVFTNKDQRFAVFEMFAATNYLYAFTEVPGRDTSELWALDGNSNQWTKIQTLVGVYQTRHGGTIGNILIWNAIDNVHGAELWKATNEPGSAKLLKDIFPGTANSYPTNFLKYHGNLYFIATPANGFYDVFKTDGTGKGTYAIAQNTGVELATAANKLFFTLNDGVTNYELYASDGTTGGTKLLKDIYPGANSPSPDYLTGDDSVLYFTANDPQHGNELWKSDGTSNGTVLVKDILAGANSSIPQMLAIGAGKLYFMAYDSLGQRHLYVSNGTEAGTKQISDAGLSGVTISNYIGGDQKLFINGYTYATGNELYAGADKSFALVKNASTDATASDQKLFVTVLGNPIQNFLRAIIRSPKEEKVSIVITDVTGKAIVTDSKLLNNGVNDIMYNTSSWAAGIYNLKVTGNDGAVISVQIVK
ncbi:MAG TPA: ELWxxDGT repeat protein [Chitinophagaceae bacterium]|nr:ELWxxDGT repeat protein [Chitinophagaceae bacterium]